MPGLPSNQRHTAAFTLTVSGDPRFIETVRTLTHKAAEADGCSDADAARLAEAVGRVLTALFGGVAATAVDRVSDVRFEPTGQAFSVEIRVPAGAVAPSGNALERSLAASGGLDAVRTLAPNAEFGAVGAQQFCRIACPRASRPS